MYYECDNERTPEDDKAIKHWNKIRRVVLTDLLNDENEESIGAANTAKECQQEIGRLTVIIEDLKDDSDYRQAVARAVQSRDPVRRRLAEVQEDAKAGETIVAYLRRQLDLCNDAT